MSSQLPLKANIAQDGRHFAFVPNCDIAASLCERESPEEVCRAFTKSSRFARA
jgi:hypothetical protein